MALLALSALMRDHRQYFAHGLKPPEVPPAAADIGKKGGVGIMDARIRSTPAGGAVLEDTVPAGLCGSNQTRDTAKEPGVGQPGKALAR